MVVLALALAMQSEPPPFIQYLEEAEALGRATYLAGACAGLGIIEFDRQAVEDLVDDFERRSIIAKTNGGLLNSAIERGIAVEKEAVARMTDLGPDDGSERRRRREAQAVEYFGDGCADLTLDLSLIHI